MINRLNTMDRSLPVGMSTDQDSTEQVPEHYCGQCKESTETVDPLAGYSIDGHNGYCCDCYSSHQRTIFKDHQLECQLTRQMTEQPSQSKHDNFDESESQLKSLKDNLDKQDKDTPIGEYKFEPCEKLNTLLNDLKVQQKNSLKKSANASVPKTKVISMAAQKRKKPYYIQDIKLKLNSDENFFLGGTLMLENKQMLLTDWVNRKIKLIETTQGTMVTEIKITGMPMSMAKVKEDEVAVIVSFPDQIQFVSVSKNSISTDNWAIELTGTCRGIAYNDKDKTFIVSFVSPSKVEILNMGGHVLKRVDKNSKGDQFFMPNCVGISPDMTTAYIADYRFKGTVTLMSMEGEIKAIYEDKYLQSPNYIYIHKSGLVYIVGCGSHTLHQFDPDKGQFKLLLERKDGLEYPVSIGYCDLENQMYVANRGNKVLKVFKMK